MGSSTRFDIGEFLSGAQPPPPNCMGITIEGGELVIKPRDHWLGEAKRHYAALQRAGGRGKTPAELEEIDSHVFWQLVEALHSLGAPIVEELVRLGMGRRLI